MADTTMQGYQLRKILNDSSVGLAWGNVVAKFLSRFISLLERETQEDELLEKVGEVSFDPSISRLELQKAIAKYLIEEAESKESFPRLSPDEHESFRKKFTSLAQDFSLQDNGPVAGGILERLIGLMNLAIQGQAPAETADEPAPELNQLQVDAIGDAFTRVSEALKLYRNNTIKPEDLKELEDQINQLRNAQAAAVAIDNEARLNTLTPFQKEIAEFTQEHQEIPNTIFEKSPVFEYANEATFKAALALSHYEEEKKSEFIANPPKASLIRDLWQKVWQEHKDANIYDLQGLFVQDGVVAFLRYLEEALKKATAEETAKRDALQSRLQAALGKTPTPEVTPEGGGADEQEEEPERIPLLSRWEQKRNSFLEILQQLPKKLEKEPSRSVDLINALNANFDLGASTALTPEQVVTFFTDWTKRIFAPDFQEDRAEEEILNYDTLISILTSLWAKDAREEEALKPATPGEAAEAAQEAAPPVAAEKAAKEETPDPLAELGKITRTQFMLRQLSEEFLSKELEQYFRNADGSIRTDELESVLQGYRDQMGDVVWTEFLSQGGLAEITFNAATLAAIAHRSSQTFAEIYRVKIGEKTNFNYTAGLASTPEQLSNQQASVSRLLEIYGFGETQLEAFLNQALQIENFKDLQRQAELIVSQDQIEFDTALRSLKRSDLNRLDALLKKRNADKEKLTPQELAEFTAILGRALPLIRYLYSPDGTLSQDRIHAFFGGAADLNSYSKTLANYQGVEGRFGQALVRTTYSANFSPAGYASPSRYALPELAETDETGKTGRNNLALEIFVIRTFIIENQLEEQGYDPQELSVIFGAGYEMAEKGEELDAQMYLEQLQSQIDDPDERAALLAQHGIAQKEHTQSGAAGLTKSAQNVKALQGLAQKGMAANPAAAAAMMALSDPRVRKMLMIAAAANLGLSGAALYIMAKPFIDAALWLVNAGSNIVNGFVGALQGIGNFVGGIFQGIFGGGAPVAGGIATGVATEAAKTAIEGAKQGAVQGKIIASDAGRQIGQGAAATGGEIAKTASTILTVTTTQAAIAGSVVAAGVIGPVLLTAIMTIIVFAVIGGSLNDWPMTGLIGGRSGVGGCWPTNGRITTLRTYADGQPHATGNRTAIDIANNIGEPIFSPFGGTAKVSYDDSYGNNVRISTSQGFDIILAHMSDVVIQDGSTVTPGQQVGFMGSTGNSSGPHLHYELVPNPGNTMEIFDVVTPTEPELVVATDTTPGTLVSTSQCKTNLVSAELGCFAFANGEQTWLDAEKTTITEIIMNVKTQLPQVFSALCSQGAMNLVRGGAETDSNGIPYGGFVARNGATIEIYDYCFDDSQDNCRFTFAHELGHVYHNRNDILSQFTPEYYQTMIPTYPIVPGDARNENFAEAFGLYLTQTITPQIRTYRCLPGIPNTEQNNTTCNPINFVPRTAAERSDYPAHYEFMKNLVFHD